MAVTAIWAVKGNAKAVIRYTANPEKTWNSEYEKAAQFHVVDSVLQYDADEMKTEKQFYVTGINCNADPNRAAEQFEQTKLSHRKTDGIACFHGYQAFKPGVVTPELAHQIGVELAERLWGERFQVVVSTHLNTGKIHNHFCINSVSFEDGKRYYDQTKTYYQMREMSDRICREHGLDVIEHPGHSTLSYEEWKSYKDERNGKLKSLYDDLDDVLKYVTSFRQFMQEIQNRGYILEYRGSFLRIRPDEGKKFRRLDRLGEGYSEEKIRQRCYDNYRRRPIPRTVPILPKREKATGLVGLFRYYCYLLEHYPKGVPPPRESYVQIRRARETAQKYTDEAMLLDRYSDLYEKGERRKGGAEGTNAVG